MEAYPEAIVYAEGSTYTRTRLYRIGISNHLEELNEKFEVYGYMKNKGWLVYEKNRDYTAFFIKNLKL